MKPMHLLQAPLLALCALCLYPDTAGAQDTTRERTKVKGYKHMVDVVISIDEKFGTFKNAPAECTVTVNVKDRGGISGTKADIDVSKTLPKITMAPKGGGGSSGQTKTPEEVAKDAKCHPENALDALPVKVSCDFGGGRKLVFDVDPKSAQHLKLQPGKNADNEGWSKAEGRELPKDDTYQGKDKKRHKAPPWTGKKQVWSGSGDLAGGGKGDATIDWFLLRLERACADEEVELEARGGEGGGGERR